MDKKYFLISIIFIFLFSSCHIILDWFEQQQDEENYSIIYPKQRFIDKLDLYNDPLPSDAIDDDLEEDMTPFNSDLQVVGYLFTIVEKANNCILRVFTVAVHKETNEEFLVDKADFWSTAMTRQEGQIVSGETGDNWATYRAIVGTDGFQRRNIQFLDTSFDRAFISLHDLRLIIEGFDFVAISGSKVTIGENFFPTETNNNLAAEYFTWKIQGFTPEYPPNYNLAKLTDFLYENPKIPYKKGNYKFIMNVPKSIKNVKFGFNSFADEESSPIPPSDLHEMSFSSPCPPRWRPGGQ